MNNIVYVKVLADSLHKKHSALENLLDLTKKQEQLLHEESFNETEFLETIRKKQGYIDKITEFDNGFDSIYNRVKEELSVDRQQYADDIAVMQKLITQITELGIDIEALENRNKTQMEKVLASRKDKIKDMRLNNSAASNYYRNMANQQYNQSFFLDKKK